MENSIVWDTLPGQVTDDSEMALALAHSIINKGCFDKDAAKDYYTEWMNSRPFDMGHTCMRGLCGRPSYASQANGAMMRVSPLAVWLAYHKGEDWEECDRCAAEDAQLTHPHEVCVQANVLFVRALVELITTDTYPNQLYRDMKKWADEISADEALRSVLAAAEEKAPEDFTTQEGWVLIAFQNAVYQLRHAKSPLEGIIETVKHGGDTDTNAAIAGAMLGAYYGLEAFPADWLEIVQNCKPGGKHPRPEIYWPGEIGKLVTEISS